MLTVLFSSLLLFSFFNQNEACTTFAVGKKATLDGSVMATHSNDGGGSTDPRLVKIPALDHEIGSMRPIYYSPENYPRYVGTDRNASQYWPENCQAGATKCQPFVPLGYIPQVNHTYAYFEATYGIMNEHQLGIAESTCSGVFATLATDHGGKALLSIDQLSQIAMERAKTSREAVLLIGSLAEQYGFYGESASFEGGAESLIITDPEEAWVFHILADPTGTSAIWVAARVPDDSVAVVANMFSIRTVDLTDTANFLGRTDMWELAASQGLWKEGDAKDFTRTFSDGEYAHKYYSGRRMWGVFHLLAPSQHLSAEYGNLKMDSPYPFAVPVDYAVTPQDMFTVMRSWYNNTEYSTSVGLASGPFQTPDRYSGGAYDWIGKGSWERTIAIYRSSDSYIIQSRNYVSSEIGGVIWWGPGTFSRSFFCLSFFLFLPPSLSRLLSFFLQVLLTQPIMFLS
jgi:dipeptidase